jgi:hypothetical protein
MKTQTFLTVNKAQHHDIRKKLEFALDQYGLLVWSAEDINNWYFIFERG